ncbi:MAG: hypothetical protein ACXWQE_06655 [Bdellovibrionales bacterium]
MPKPFRKLILLNLVLCLALGCARTSSPDKKEGGQDGGGGQGKSSTPEEVRLAIEQAYQLFNSETYFANIFTRFWFAETAGAWEPGGKLDPRALFPFLVERQNTFNTEANFSSPGLKILGSIRPTLITSGDCEQRTRPHADASVTRYDETAQVCFSVGNLTRLPPSSLLGEILGLMLHEAIHLGGEKSETVAEEWQHSFLEYFRWRFGALASEQIGPNTLKEIDWAGKYLAAAVEMNRRNPAHTNVFVLVGAFARFIINLPHLLDPVALNLALQPKNPLLATNYANAVLALYEETEINFFSSNVNFFKIVPIAKIRPHQIEVYLLKMNKHLEIVKDIFKNYLSGEGETRCLLPKAMDLPFEIQTEKSGAAPGSPHYPYFNNLTPPHECAPGTVLIKEDES